MIRGPIARLVDLVRLALERLAHEQRRRRFARAERAAARIPLTIERRQLWNAEDRRR